MSGAGGKTIWQTHLHPFALTLATCLLWSTSVADSPSAKQLALERLKSQVAADYPSVRQVSVQEYQTNPENTLLIDVRSAEEFAVSHIPGAVHLPGHQQLLDFALAHPEQQLVLYCSVGVRSSLAAQYLAQNDVVSVANLAGSIFEWSNRGLPLVDSTGPAQKVHPFNMWWGMRYLDPPAPPVAH